MVCTPFNYWNAAPMQSWLKSFYHYPHVDQTSGIGLDTRQDTLHIPQPVVITPPPPPHKTHTREH